METIMKMNMQGSKIETPLGIYDIISLTIGMVIGVSIFKTPALVAHSVASGIDMLVIWEVGALISMAGGLCYAELSSTYPSDGGDYFFLKKAFGRDFAFVYAWSRISVIQTGSIALLAFLLGIAIIIILGLFYLPSFKAQYLVHQKTDIDTNWGYCLILVLLTFGGWNEAAYLFGVVSKKKRKFVLAFIFSLMSIAVLYLLVNLSFLRGLGLANMGASKSVAVDLAVLAFDSIGLWAIVIIVTIATITSTNATIFTGAKSLGSFKKDLEISFLLTRPKSKIQKSTQSYYLQAVLALLLVFLGQYSRNGFETMIDYTAPIFWFFLFMTGLSLIILRIKEPKVARPFSVPLYPILPFLFCCSSLYLFYASIHYSGWGSYSWLFDYKFWNSTTDS
ncbi:APC family permease [Zunongwangia sp.]|uniref:APC family permease n=1 Tax=Zunongwangia sp. TaxID=1965325 RepID=UPI003AA947BE